MAHAAHGDGTADTQPLLHFQSVQLLAGLRDHMRVAGNPARDKGVAGANAVDADIFLGKKEKRETREREREREREEGRK